MARIQVADLMINRFRATSLIAMFVILVHMAVIAREDLAIRREPGRRPMKARGKTGSRRQVVTGG